MIYVPSRGRAHLLAKTAPSWVETGMPVIMAVDEEQVPEYRYWLGSLGLPIQVFAAYSGSIGAARQWILEQASERDQFHIQVDDDFIVPPNLHRLIQVLQSHPEASSAAGWQRIYTSWVDDGEDEVVVNKTSMGQQVRAYRNKPLLDLGGFDRSLRLGEDVEATMRVGWATGMRPLLVRSVPVRAVNQRGGEGGCSTYGGHTANGERLIEVITNRYGPGICVPSTGSAGTKIYMAKFWKRVELRRELGVF